MKRIILYLALSLILSTACSLGGIGANEDAPAPASEQRCGDNVCDGPENPEICPQDCAGIAQPESDNETDVNSEESQAPATDSQAQPVIGVVFAEVELDRTPGNGDCGIDPWYSPDCSSIKLWWGLNLRATAQSVVLIIPDGDQRWVVSNHGDVTAKYNINLNDFLSTNGGTYQDLAIDFSPAPECSGEIEGTDFHFQVMGTRQDGNLELILSANPEEFVQGACAGTGFQYTTSHLLYGWAAALSGDPLDLSFDMNDTFRQQPGHYLAEISVDTNPSPENRDRVESHLEFMCIGSQPASVLEPVPCPWEE